MWAEIDVSETGGLRLRCPGVVEHSQCCVHAIGTLLVGLGIAPKLCTCIVIINIYIIIIDTYIVINGYMILSHVHEMLPTMTTAKEPVHPCLYAIQRACWLLVHVTAA